MVTTKLLESYWPADTTRATIDASIGTTLAKTAAEVPDRVALIEVVPASVPSPVGSAMTDRQWTYA